MNGQVFPLFEDAHILRTSMLIQLRDYAFTYGRLEYQDYSNGIISGCKLTTTEDTITLNQGLIHYANHIYLITEPLSLEYYPSDEWVLFKIRFLDETQKNGCIYRAVEIELTDDMEIATNEFELCRFKLQQGARLRSDYVDFYDRNTEYDTLNTIHSPFSAPNKSSISPEITCAFAKESLNYETDQLDKSFFMQALNGKTALNRDSIEFYLAIKFQMEYTKLTNEEIFKSLCELLDEFKNRGERDIKRDVAKRHQIIVDW